MGKAWRKRLAAVLVFMCVGLTACGVRTLPLWESAQGMVECYDGERTYEYANGDRYEGEFKAGQGEWKDGMIYNGL